MSYHGVIQAYGRALRSQFSGRMLVLSLVPLLLSLALWGFLLWMYLQPLLDWLHALFAGYGGFEASGSLLGAFGLGVLKVMAVPLVAMLLLLPLMIGSSLLFMGLAAMPAIGRHVARRQFPALERKQGGSMLGSIGVNLSAMLVVVLVWGLTLPLYLVPPLAMLAQAILWGWVTARVMSYDALADYATPDERAQLVRRHRRQLMAMGMVTGLLGALPGVAWIGGALLSVVLFPILAMLSVWLYIIIFMFSGLWFQYYCMQALQDLRAEQGKVVAA